ncbi:MAG: GNAT family N-acetyltransferase [Candidatus Omnitrophota bacterium]
MIRIEEISTLAGFKDMEAEWGSLLGESGSTDLFLTFDWLFTWWKHFSAKNTLFILRITEGGVLVGIAPLMIRRYKLSGFPVRGVFFMGFPVSDRMDFILKGPDKAGYISAILKYLKANARRWDLADFQEMPGPSGNFRVLRERAGVLGFPAIHGDDKKSFYLSFRGTRDDFLKSLSGNTLQHLRKASRRLRKKDPGFQCRRFIGALDGKMNPGELVSEMERIEGLSWKGGRGTGIFSRADTRGFHADIINNYFGKGLLDISFLRVNGANIAYQYNYLSGSRIYNYSIAYDRRYGDLSPGFALYINILEDSFGRGIDEFDFLRGDEGFKKSLASDYRIHARTRMFNHSPYSKFLFAAHGMRITFKEAKGVLFKKD